MGANETESANETEGIEPRETLAPPAPAVGAGFDIPATRSPWRLVLAVLLPLLLLGGIVVAAKLFGGGRDGSANQGDDAAIAMSTLPDEDNPEGNSATCDAFVKGLPDELDGHRLAPLALPAPGGAAAWRNEEGTTILLRCGVRMPSDYEPTAKVTTFTEKGDGWWYTTDGDRITYFAIDRRPYIVAVTMDTSAGTAPLIALQKPLDTLPRA